MKKIIVSIVLISYLAVTSGVIVNFHYCMNKLASTQLFASESKECGKCGMHIDRSHGCCRDEVKIVKMEEDQKLTAAVSYDLAAPVAVVQQLSSFLIAPSFTAPSKGSYQNHSPPLLTEQDTYLRNCVFRI